MTQLVFLMSNTLQPNLEDVAIQTNEYIDEKRIATISVYEQNFQTVASRLIETKLEDHETIGIIEKPERVEKVQTRLVHLEGSTAEQTSIDDTFLESDVNEEVVTNKAIPTLHETEPFVSSSNLHEEGCNELKTFSAEEVRYRPN